MRQERIVRPRQTRRRRSERRERPLAVAPTRADCSAGADEVLSLIDDTLRDARPAETPGTDTPRTETSRVETS